MTLTRQEMLSAIEQKMARAGGGTGPGETGYYLPVTQDDVYFYANTQRARERILLLWKGEYEPLDKQSDDCISYIYDLLSHD